MKMNKELEWRKKRAGKITASALKNLDFKQGKWTQTAITYLYSLQRERLLGVPRKQIKTYYMEKGNEDEPYAIDWLRTNSEYKVEHCDVDFDEKVFIVTDFGFGDSPDGYAYNNGERLIVECKCLYTDQIVNWFFSPTVPLSDKRDFMFKEHCPQMCGHLLAHPDIDKIILMIYDPMDDDDDFDTRDTMDKTRGIYFVFERSEFGKKPSEFKKRIEFANEYIDSGENLEKINEKWLITKYC